MAGSDGLERGLAARWVRRALKTEDKTRKEEKEVERLVREAPSKKPPRRDRTRTLIKDPDPDLNSSDPDLSLHSKKARSSAGEQEPRWRVLEPEEGRDNWLVVDDEGHRNYFQSEDEAEEFLAEEASDEDQSEYEEDGSDYWGEEDGPDEDSEEESRREILRRFTQAPAEAPLQALPPAFRQALEGDSTSTDWDAEAVRDAALAANPVDLFALRRVLEAAPPSPAGEVLRRALDQADAALAKAQPLTEDADLAALFPPVGDGEARQAWVPRYEVAARQLLSIANPDVLSSLTSRLQSDAESDDQEVSQRAAHMMRLLEEENRARAVSSQISLGALASARDDLLGGFLPGASGAPPSPDKALRKLDSMMDSDLERAVRDIPAYAVSAGLLNETDRLTAEGRSRLRERVRADLELHAALSVLRRAGGSDFEREVLGAPEAPKGAPPFHHPAHLSKLRSVLWERPSGLWAKLKAALPAEVKSKPPEQVLSWFDRLCALTGGPPPSLKETPSMKPKMTSASRRHARTVGQPLPGPVRGAPASHAVPYPDPEPQAVSSPRRLELADFLDLFEEATSILEEDPSCRATIMAPEVACRIAVDKAVWEGCGGRYQHAVDAPSWRALYRMVYFWSQGTPPPPSLGSAR